MWKDEKFRHLRAPKDKVLVLIDGQIIESLGELSEAISQMAGSQQISLSGGPFLQVGPTFQHHVNETKNDFADWVEDAFGLTELGKSLREHNTPFQMLVHIEGFLHVREYPVPGKES